MIQQILALIIIAFFIIKLFKQKSKHHITQSEFSFWLIFWILATFAIIFLKQLDTLVKNLGFSTTGINFLLYIAVIILFYFIFKMRLKLVTLENKITKLSRELSLKHHDRKDS